MQKANEKQMRPLPILLALDGKSPHFKTLTEQLQKWNDKSNKLSPFYNSKASNEDSQPRKIVNVFDTTMTDPAELGNLGKLLEDIKKADNGKLALGDDYSVLVIETEGGCAAYNYYLRCRPILACWNWPDVMTFGKFVQLQGRADRRGGNAADLSMYLYSDKSGSKDTIEASLMHKEDYPSVDVNDLSFTQSDSESSLSSSE